MKYSKNFKATLSQRTAEYSHQFSSVQSLRRVWLFATPWLQHARPPCPSPIPRVYSNSCPLSQWCHPTISSCRPLLLPPSIFPSIRVFSNEPTLRMRWPEYWSFSFSISPSSEYSGIISFRMHWFSPGRPRDSQESFPTPRFKGTISSVLNFLYSPTLMPIHNYWKNHSFD